MNNNMGRKTTRNRTKFAVITIPMDLYLTLRSLKRDKLDSFGDVLRRLLRKVVSKDRVLEYSRSERLVDLAVFHKRMVEVIRANG